MMPKSGRASGRSPQSRDQKHQGRTQTGENEGRDRDAGGRRHSVRTEVEAHAALPLAFQPDRLDADLGAGYRLLRAAVHRGIPPG